MTTSARAPLPLGVHQESHVLATATHQTSNLDLLNACIDGVRDYGRGGLVGSPLRGQGALEAAHDQRIGHVSLPAKSVGVPAASELHVLSLTSVTRNAKIMGELGTELRTAWQQPRSPVTPTLSQESWCSAMLDGATSHAQIVGAESLRPETVDSRPEAIPFPPSVLRKVARRARAVEFDIADVIARRLPDHDGGAKREGVLYILEFSSGLIKVGRTAQPKKRVETHLRHIRLYAGASLVRGWLSPFHENFLSTEAALIGRGHALSRSVQGNEFLVGAPFPELVSFARTLLYLPPMQGPLPYSNLSAWADSIARAVAEAQARSESTGGAERRPPSGDLPPPASGEEGEEGEEMLEALIRLTAAVGEPVDHAFNMTFFDMLALRNEQEIRALTAELRASLATSQTKAYAEGRTELFEPMLTRAKYPELWSRHFEDEPEETEEDRAASVAWVDSMRDRYLREVSLNQHDDGCEFTDTFWICECPRRRREASGFTELPGPLIWQAPRCPRCRDTVRDDAGVGWICETCNIEWSRDGDQSLFMDVLGQEPDWVHEVHQDVRCYSGIFSDDSATARGGDTA